MKYGSNFIFLHADIPSYGEAKTQFPNSPRGQVFFVVSGSTFLPPKLLTCYFPISFSLIFYPFVVSQVFALLKSKLCPHLFL